LISHISHLISGSVGSSKTFGKSFDSLASLSWWNDQFQLKIMEIPGMGGVP